MTYNFEQYIKLLEYQRKLSEEKKYLRNENPVKYLELLKQATRISEHLYWLQKQEFKQLINDFLSSKMNGKESNLEILDRGRLIFLQNFDGQLEIDSQGIPCWNVYLQTTALITSRCVAKAISKDLFATKQSIDSSINIYSLSNFQQCQRKKLLAIPNSKFYPGHFRQIVIQFEELLKTDQVQEAIEKRPEILLLTKE